MVNFTVDQLREIMKNPEMIRNLSVIAHIDHGKSTLTDSLLAMAGFISKDDAGNKRVLDDREDEIERGITIKSSGISMCLSSGNEQFVFNLIDSPGHVDFSSEVTAALRVTDGALVVVDCVESVCVQTETVLRQAMQERIKPVLFLNKVDRTIFELELDEEAMYKRFRNTIESVNIIISTYSADAAISEELCPVKGSVAFGSGKDCWGFNLSMFADLYQERFKIEKSKLIERLWGDNYYDSETKVWKSVQDESEVSPSMKRGFTEYVMKPIVAIAKAALQSDKEKIKTICERMNIYLTPEELTETGKKLCRLVLSKWMNVAQCVVDMSIKHLPSPKKAQAYRYSYLYEGDLDDPCAQAIKNCDPEGPLMVYVSKMLPSGDSGRFLAFGRVFSGTARVGQKVVVMGPNFVAGSKVDIYEGNIQGCDLIVGKKKEHVSDIVCGNTGALIGLDKLILKNGTVTDSKTAANIRAMKYSVSPVVRVAIEPVNPQDTAKLIEGMRKLVKVDNLVVCTVNESTGEKVVAGSGELHVSICLDDLEKYYARVPIKRSNPIVPYRETIEAEGEECKSKSSNKHNRLVCRARPLNEDFVTAFEYGNLRAEMDKTQLNKIMIEEYGFDKKEVLSLWSFSTADNTVNTFMDLTEGCSYMKEIKDSCVRSFEKVCSEGVLMDEPLRGVNFELRDTQIHSDNAHRGPSQIMPCAKRVLYGAQLLAKPRICEPYYLLEVSCVDSCVGGVYSIINARKGKIVDQISVSNSPIQLIKAYIPVAKSFKINEDLRASTSGQAFPSLVFDHWELVQGDPLAKTDNPARKIVNEVRLRKGLKTEVPSLDEFLDKF